MIHMAAARGALFCLQLGHIELRPRNSATIGCKWDDQIIPIYLIFNIYDGDLLEG